MKLKPTLKIPTLLIVFCLLFLTVSVAHADGLVGCKNNCTLGDLVLLVLRIINFLLSLSSIVAMVFIVWGGFSMVIAGGNEERLGAAKTILTQAIVGFFLILISFVILNTITVILSGFTLQQLFQFLPKSG